MPEFTTSAISLTLARLSGSCGRRRGPWGLVSSRYSIIGIFYF